MTGNILRVFNMKYLLILLLFTCSTIQTSISKPPEIQNLIDELKFNNEIQDTVKTRIISTLENSMEYNSECFNKNILLEKENFFLKDKIQKLELEIQTWRTIKNSFLIILISGILILIGFTAWKFRKLLGSPI